MWLALYFINYTLYLSILNDAQPYSIQYGKKDLLKHSKTMRDVNRAFAVSKDKSQLIHCREEKINKWEGT